MRMSRQEDFDVLQLEPKLVEVRANHRVHLPRPRVDHDVALGRRDEIRGNVSRTNVVDVANDAERFHGFTHLAVELCSRFRRERRGLRREDDRTHDNRQHSVTHGNLLTLSGL